ncbi:MAG: helicase [Oscillospiraceae bacterium]|nr:helicase [Oscillospiraceae bacterium]
MQQTPFHAYYTARLLDNVSNENGLVSVYASANIEIYPYQIAAAQFALRSPYLNGCILGDEGSLGKTYEALLVATQMWHEGKTRQLIILPVNMLNQWIKKFDNSFTLPYLVIDNNESDIIKADNLAEQDCVIVTTYEFAIEKAEWFKEILWDLIIFDEADRLNKVYDENAKNARILKELSDGAFKLLLTPTPITKDIRDIYGLIYFIDETVLPDDIETFYNTYFRHTERYPELAKWVSQFCFRTLKEQVSEYVNFTRRIPYTVSYDFSEEEKLLYNALNAYIMRPQKIAYPNMSSRDKNNMTIQWNHILSSSSQAIAETIDGAINRLKKAEVQQSKKAIFMDEIRCLNELHTLAKAVDINGKMKALLPILKKCFTKLKQLKYPNKAIVFTDSQVTLKKLKVLLDSAGYNLLTYSGSNSRDYSIMERFRNDKEIQILIATDDMGKGLDIEFCPIVINYDMLSNAPLLEQRINRCHRQGQKCDVLVVNLFNKNNYADTRYFELINKRVLQFNGIFGMSDALLGNFDNPIDEVLCLLRPQGEIQNDFENNLSEHENQNRHIVASSEDTLFTTFTKDISDKVIVTPKYISEKINEVNRDLWNLTKWFFDDYNYTNDECQYIIDEQSQTVTATDHTKLPHLFYYWVNGQSRHYKGLKGYGISKDYKPHYGRITLSTPFAKGLLQNVECATKGALTVNANIEACTIGLYVITVKSQNKAHKSVYREYVELVGETESGKVISGEECDEILNLPVVDYSEDDKKSAPFMKYTYQSHSNIDKYISADEYIRKSVLEKNSVQSEEIERMRLRAAKEKTALEREVNDLKSQIAAAEKEAESLTIRIKRLEIERKLSGLHNELMQKEENLFLGGIQADSNLQKQIGEFLENEKLTVKIERQFLLKVRGNK